MVGGWWCVGGGSGCVRYITIYVIISDIFYEINFPFPLHRISPMKTLSSVYLALRGMM